MRESSNVDLCVRSRGWGERVVVCALAACLAAMPSTSLRAQPVFDGGDSTGSSANKLHALLKTTAPPEWIIAPRAAERADVPGGSVIVLIQFTKSTTLADVHRTIQRHGGEVRSSVPRIATHMAVLPWASVRAVAAEPGVTWVEPALPPLGPMNSSVRANTGVDAIQVLPYDLQGRDIRVLLYDTGAAMSTHADFSLGGGLSRVTPRDSSSVSFHSTHVAGTIAGSGALSSGLHRGMAPLATIESYGLDFADQAGTFVTDLGDVEADYTEAFRDLSCMIASNSVGVNVAASTLPCSLEGDYVLFAALIDDFISRGIAGSEFPVRAVWAAGNERGNGRCGTAYATLPPPTSAKNPICVGALNSNDGSLTTFSSWGPADDGRLKPDICAPGCQSTDDNGVTSTWWDGNYAVLCGTSMAAPTVTGICALLLEDFAAQFPSRAQPLNSTLKALLIQSALDIESPGPDFRTGYGAVRAQHAVDLMRTGQFLETSVDEGTVWTGTIDVPPGAPELRITLAWDDPAGAPASAQALVNDLDLIVIDPLSGREYPWTLDPMNPAALAVRSGEDHTNNVEQVVVDSPLAGEWIIEIHGTNVPEGPQGASLVSSAPISATSLHIESASLDFVEPASTTTIAARLTILNDSILASPTLHWRFDGGTFNSTSMTLIAPALYEADITGGLCNGSLEYYVSIESTSSGIVTDPPLGAAAPIAVPVALEDTLIAEDFELDTGWQVGEPGDTATAGLWTRADPIGTGAQPETDRTSDPGALCFFTGQGTPGGPIGEADVDGGATTLLSPVIDLSSAPDCRIRFWLWYSNTGGAFPNQDQLSIELSDNAGMTWFPALTIGPTGLRTYGGWFDYEIRVQDIFSPTSFVQMRIVAADAGSGSIVEAAFDELTFVSRHCKNPPACPGDVDGNNSVDVNDITFVVFRLGNSGLPGSVLGDADGNGSVDVNDIAFIVFRLGQACV